MPRGTRAVHDTGGESWEHDPAIEASIVRETNIDCTCWCERAVVRINRLMWLEFMITGSCGEDNCANPTGGPSARVLSVKIGNNRRK